MTIQEAAIHSGRKYLAHLKETGKGIVEYNVKSIKQDINAPEKIYITLDKHPFLYDSLQVKILTKVFEHEYIRPLEYNSQKKILTVKAKKEYISVLINSDIKKVQVVSDLKFLVERVIKWYTDFGNLIQLPSQMPLVRPFDLNSLLLSPSEDQITAINGIFSAPFSYVWGAPGTGKTQVILANAVLSYIAAGKKVLVTAPTNNALEQTLRGLLPVMESAGYSYDDLVIRYGVASTAFFEKYPGVCENIALEKELALQRESVESVKKEMEHFKTLLGLFPKYRKYIAATESLRLFIANAPVQIAKMRKYAESVPYLENEIKVLNGRIAVDRKAIEDLKKEIHKHSDRISKITNELKKFERPLRKKLWYKKYRSLFEELEHLVLQEETVQNTITEKEEEISKCRCFIEEQQNTIAQNTESFGKEKQSLIHMASFHPELSTEINRICVKHFTDRIQNLERFILELQKRADEKAILYTELTDIDEESCIDRIQRLETQLTEYNKRIEDIAQEGSTSKRAEKCLVFAVTLDSCLYRLTPNEKIAFSHVFLDEAGYCQLIKGCTLLAYGCPVTFLGDHMQLPPVCEISEEKFELDEMKYVFMWAQSALHAETLLKQGAESAYNSFIRREPAMFSDLKKFDLLQTYRFGESLANVLCNDVYAKNFHSKSAYGTDIYYIDSPKNADEQGRRASTSECLSIVSYLKKYQNEDIGIITPYKDQRERLKEELEKNIRGSSERVFTVHGSQGREWNTVIFSVVDTTNKWFTNSLNKSSAGKQVINTAVSRARQKLIIVCDYRYWIAQENQLIGKILKIAKPYLWEL